MGAEEGLLEIIKEAAGRKHIAEAIYVSTTVLMVYDWLLVLPQEVKHIWCASWNYTKLLYLFIRYIPFISMSLMLRNQLSSGMSPSACKMSLEAVCWLSVVGVTLTEVVLAVRTYAVWNKDKRVGIGLGLLLALFQIPNGIIAQKFLNSINFIMNPYPEIFHGCVAPSAIKITFVSWVLFTVLEGVVLALMVVSALRSGQKTTSKLLNVVYMDGIRFYVYIFIVTFTNVVITLILPIDFIGVGSCLEIVLHSNLACRLMVGLREAGHSPRLTSDAFELSELTNDETVVFAHGTRRRHSSESSWMHVESHAGPSEP